MIFRGTFGEGLGVGMPEGIQDLCSTGNKKEAGFEMENFKSTVALH